jgi:lipid II:glycine glycyltransferase (peptidoglycan interpeptide bridge formation enzyme)
MLLRPVREEEHALYNKVVDHPLQSWEWGNFRSRTGLKVERIGFFDHNQLKKALQVTFHPVPGFGGRTIGYLPKGFMPDEEQLAALKQLAEQHNSLFIKLEPNVANKVDAVSAHSQVAEFLQSHGAVPGRQLFNKYTFQLSLDKTEEQLFEGLASKTRYNVNVAYKKGVQIVENTSAEGMENYLSVLSETTKRQGFYLHTENYFRTMWEVMGGSGIMRIFEAHYEGQILVSWVIFVFNDMLYYPYGASRSAHRDVMASNLMMWEMIRLGKSLGLRAFDMWGCLGPEPDEKDPRFGFHRFKKGYGGDHLEFLGTYDLVTNPPLYKLFTLVDNVRWKLLRLRTYLPF